MNFCMCFISCMFKIALVIVHGFTVPKCNPSSDCDKADDFVCVIYFVYYPGSPKKQDT